MTDRPIDYPFKDIEATRRYIQEDMDLRLARQPLHQAARAGDIKEVGRLLESGSDIEVRDSYGMGPLAFAVAHNQTAVVALLLERGAQVNAHDLYGYTPLHHAALRGHQEIAQLLLNQGARLDDRRAHFDSRGHTPLELARAQIQNLIKIGASEEAITPIQEVVKLLIQDYPE